METTLPAPPHIQGPSSKEKKYDRQLRLWAASGQASLEDAHVLLVQAGPSAVGIEALKNLILPGVGQYTIVDPCEVMEEDAGVNFFVEEDCVGQPRAKVSCEMLQELNPDVKGRYIAQPVEALLRDPEFLSPYTLILLVSPISSLALKTIATYAWEQHVPLFHIHSLGFYSHFTVCLPPSFPVVETHPDPTTTTDLRLTNPWPELSALAKEKTDGLERMNDHDHGHVPCVLLLLHYLEAWKQKNDGRVPATYREKQDFRKAVERGARIYNAEGGEENYEEAAKAVLKSLNPTTLSRHLREIFQAKECTTLTKDSPRFWVIASAIKTFESRHHVLPLPGSVPDMKAKSADYIRLQNVYKAKARRDAAEVLATVRAQEQALGRTDNPISEAEVENFCKEAAFVRLFRGEPLQVVSIDGNGNPIVGHEEPGSECSDGLKSIRLALEDTESLMPLYITFLAYDVFTNRDVPLDSDPAGASTLLHPAPGHADSSVHGDEHKLLRIALSILSHWYTGDSSEIGSRISDFVREIVRFGGGDLHNISALTGGMVAQEAIKVITRQYVPADNTVVFDGIRSKVWVFRRTAGMFRRR
ncbi:hypothetical protein FGG08_000158 [Glutinoglossum americanum]|uniref:NEDD8-activating enzyme E1 regulatory subunit n=1 Tax=Glutinoglossum americanum TaxID=1670608 RepID=A0A9P8L664_9PEZI|nr:hypothetical protein FGG08_000158 [Glutinoglossum americanum]